MAKDFIGINHGKKVIEIGSEFRIVQLKPTEIHLREDGDIDNNPSVAIVMENAFGPIAFGQLSLKMWNEGLADVGYEIVKLK